MSNHKLYGRTMPEIYQRLKEAKAEIDNHYSDLYVRKTPKVKKIVEEYRETGRVTVLEFTSEIDGKQWYDLPFQYTPYWDEVAERSRRRGRPAQ